MVEYADCGPCRINCRIRTELLSHECYLESNAGQEFLE